MVSQNGAPPGKKNSASAAAAAAASAALPELEYREKAKDSGSKKQNAAGMNNNNSILQHPLDSKVQEAEYMETCGGAKRLNNELAGESDSAREDSATAAGRSYRNGGGVSNSSPRNHSASNGSVASGGRSERRQKGAGRGQKDPVENCIPNNQLGKPDALVR